MSLLDLFIAPAYAQAAGAPPSPWSLPIMVGVFFVVFYFFIIRPQSKRAKEHKAMLGALAKGDEVVTAGGLVGRVDEIGSAFISVEIAEGTRVKLQKHAITHVLPKGTIKAG